MRTMKPWPVARLVFLFLFALATLAQAFPVDQCPADRYGDDLGCTANDVAITGMSVVGDTTSCVGGTYITLDLQMTVNFAVPDRWDVGIFISNDGKSPQTRAGSGGAATCSVSVLPTASPFLNLDGPTDTCGDGNGSIGSGTGSGIHYMPNVTVPCQSLAGASGLLYIPFVVSWDNQKTPPGGVCTSNADPVPNTKSKCNAPTVLQGSVAVVVMPTITKSDGVGKTTMFSGDSTTYEVTITNTTGASLDGAVFKDPAVSGIAATSVSCAAAGGASCPGSSTVAAMQGAGITIPDMPAGGSVTFSIGATLTGSPGNTRTNTASVTVGTQVNTASDTNTIVDSIAILPTPQAKTSDKNSTVTYSYTLYNFGASDDTISLSAVSSMGWTVAPSPTPVTIAAGGSTTITLTVTVPASASIGDVDTTAITATSSAYAGKTATATAVTTITGVLTLTPSNTGAVGAGSYVYYSHRVQNNASSSNAVSLAAVFSGCTGTWTSALFESNRTTALSSPVTLAANGGYKDFVLKVGAPLSATSGATCTATLTASYSGQSASVTDVTTIKNLLLYEDPGYATEQYTYPTGNNVYAKGFGLDSSKSYEYRWYDSSGSEVCTPRQQSTTGTTFPDTCAIPAAGPLGTWTVQIWNKTNNVLLVQSNFYVGPDHLKAGYTGADPALNTDTVISLALHDKTHVVPFDTSGNLVKGNPADTEGPLMITVTVGGSATIVSTTLSNPEISGQSVTGKLDGTAGTATLTIRDSIAETVTVTPVSYKSSLAGSPTRDESATLTFVSPPLNHIRLEHTGSGVTCLPSTVTVKACADAACSSLISTSTTVTLSPAAGWVTNPVSFTGSTTVALAKATPQTVTLGTSTVAPAPAGTSPKCFVGATETCSLEFKDTGFIFSATAGGDALTVPTQTAGVATGTYYLRAIQTNTSTQTCEAALTGANTVKFAYECNNPATCYGSDLLAVNGGSGSTMIARNNSGSVSSYTSVAMTFDANGNAPFTFNYGDVGQITLWASKAAGGSLLKSLTGSSNAFVVRPYGFAFSGIKCTTANAANCAPGAMAMATPGDNPAAADAGGASFIQAGNPFTASISAVALSGAVTPSFGRESVAEGVLLSRSLVAPGSGASGSLAGTSTVAGASFQGTSKGVATVTDLSWSEVGIITLSAAVADGNYLATGAGAATATPSGNVGRFIPHHFAVAAPVAVDACPPFTYFGQDGFTTTFTLAAQNSANATTTNYAGAWAKLGLTTWANFGFTAAALPAGSALTSSATAPTGTWSSGSATVAAKHQISRPTNPAVPTTVTVTALPVDSDGVTMPAAAAVGNSQQRFGILRLDNAYGSELLPIRVPVRTMYCNAVTGTNCSDWRTNTDDGCTALASTMGSLAYGASGTPLANANFRITGTDPNTGAGTTGNWMTTNPLTLAAGTGTIVLNKPCVGGPGAACTAAVGSVDLTLGLATSMPWLQGTWTSTGAWNEDPRVRLRFGSPKAPYIYLRERY